MARKFPHSYIVCTCKQVSLGEILYAINEKNAKNFEDLERLTDAGGCCCSCKNKDSDIGEVKMDLYLENILDKLARDR